MKHRYQPRSSRVFLVFVAAAMLVGCSNSQPLAGSATDGAPQTSSLDSGPKQENTNQADKILASLPNTNQQTVGPTTQDGVQPKSPSSLQLVQQVLKAPDGKWYAAIAVVTLSLSIGLIFRFVPEFHFWKAGQQRPTRPKKPELAPSPHISQQDSPRIDPIDSEEPGRAFIQLEQRFKLLQQQLEQQNTSVIQQLQSDFLEMKAELARLATAIEESHASQLPNDLTHKELPSTIDPSFTIQAPDESSRPQQHFPPNNKIPSSSAGFSAFLAGIAQASQESPDQPPTRTPLKATIKEYQTAAQSKDRSLLRRMTTAELNITSESEESLVRGSTSHVTQLRSVPGGGSYILIAVEANNWLFPTFLTLESFNTNQPVKGIFTYERKLVSSAELKLPAEVKEVGSLWEVVKQGTVIVPG